MDFEEEARVDGVEEERVKGEYSPNEVGAPAPVRRLWPCRLRVCRVELDRQCE